MWDPQHLAELDITSGVVTLPTACFRSTQPETAHTHLLCAHTRINELDVKRAHFMAREVDCPSRGTTSMLHHLTRDGISGMKLQ